ncbi:MAG: DNA-directed RNA polymerase subunit D [Candidatus Pacearchaeota archaeon]
MKKIEDNKNQLVFRAKIDETLANSVRRYINQIPILAIDEVEISKNDSALYDETLAHRIGLIPIKREKISDKKSTKLVLHVKKEGLVYSGDLKGQLSVVYKNIPITMLSENKELELTAFVRFGKGIEHAKFSPGLMFYRNVTEIPIDKDFYDKIKEELPPSVEIKEDGKKLVIIDNGKIEISDVCEGIFEKKKKKIEIQKKDELVITIESFGQMDPAEIFIESIEVLKKDLSDFRKNINKI